MALLSTGRDRKDDDDDDDDDDGAWIQSMHHKREGSLPKSDPQRLLISRVPFHIFPSEYNV